MLSILIVEDDELFAAALTEILTVRNYTVQWAENGLIAIELLGKYNFDCVISDVQMPRMSGIQLAAWMKENTNIPLIMMTGHADEIDTQMATRANAVNLLLKPFSDVEVNKAIDLAIKGTQTRFVHVPISSLPIEGCADFNIYQMRDNQPQKIVSRGENFNWSRLNLDAQSQIFVEAESLNAVMSRSILVAKAAAITSHLDENKRAQIMQDSIRLIFDKVDILGFDQETLKKSTDLIMTYLNSIESENIWDLLCSLQRNNTKIYTQTLMVTAVSMVIARERKLSREECFKLATAAFFHNLGKIHLPADLIDKPWPLLSIKERGDFQKHVELSFALMTKDGVIAEEICQIVLQHKENCEGTGYPRGLKRDQIHVLARLLHVADEFCSTLLHTKNKTPRQIADQLMRNEQLDQQFVSVLNKLLTPSEVKTSA